MFLLAIFQAVSAAIWRREIDTTKNLPVRRSEECDVVHTQAYAVLYILERT